MYRNKGENECFNMYREMLLSETRWVMGAESEKEMGK